MSADSNKHPASVQNCTWSNKTLPHTDFISNIYCKEPLGILPSVQFVEFPRPGDAQWHVPYFSPKGCTAVWQPQPSWDKTWWLTCLGMMRGKSHTNRPKWQCKNGKSSAPDPLLKGWDIFHSKNDWGKPSTSLCRTLTVCRGIKIKKLRENKRKIKFYFLSLLST